MTPLASTEILRTLTGHRRFSRLPAGIEGSKRGSRGIMSQLLIRHRPVKYHCNDNERDGFENTAPAGA